MLRSTVSCSNTGIWSLTSDVVSSFRDGHPCAARIAWESTRQLWKLSMSESRSDSTVTQTLRRQGLCGGIGPRTPCIDMSVKVTCFNLTSSTIKHEIQRKRYAGDGSWMLRRVRDGSRRRDDGSILGSVINGNANAACGAALVGAGVN